MGLVCPVSSAPPSPVAEYNRNFGSSAPATSWSPATFHARCTAERLAFARSNEAVGVRSADHKYMRVPPQAATCAPVGLQTTAASEAETAGLVSSCAPSDFHHRSRPS